eukprot:TRINITY_DN6617_c0_g1_i5.p1 TRINITY_DN6617_c0_g1~~TRINITY_DN6617_c0_g1_i5.p1  ORF type:complete len:1724 (+),score=221.45 TRINITY_DN6617_c0_g1_i5:141-5174(+)
MARAYLTEWHKYQQRTKKLRSERENLVRIMSQKARLCFFIRTWRYIVERRSNLDEIADFWKTKTDNRVARGVFQYWRVALKAKRTFRKACQVWERSEKREAFRFWLRRASIQVLAQRFAQDSELRRLQKSWQCWRAYVDTCHKRKAGMLVLRNHLSLLLLWRTFRDWRKFSSYKTQLRMRLELTEQFIQNTHKGCIFRLWKRSATQSRQARNMAQEKTQRQLQHAFRAIQSFSRLEKKRKEALMRVIYSERNSYFRMAFVVWRNHTNYNKRIQLACTKASSIPKKRFFSVWRGFYQKSLQARQLFKDTTRKAAKRVFVAWANHAKLRALKLSHVQTVLLPPLLEKKRLTCLRLAFEQIQEFTALSKASNSILEALSRRSKQRIFSAWKRYVAQRALLRIKFDLVTKARRSGLLRMCYSIWSYKFRLVEKRLYLCRVLIRADNVSNAKRALTAWKKLVLYRRIVTTQTLQRNRKLLYLALEHWWLRSQTSITERKYIELVKLRRDQYSQRNFFKMWLQATQLRLQSKEAYSRKLSKNFKAAFLAWRSYAALQRSERHQVYKIVETLKRKPAARSLAVFAVRRWANVLASTAFDSWKSYLVERIRRKEGLGIAFQHLYTKTLQRALVAWTLFVSRNRRRRLASFLRRRTLQAQVFHAWSGFCQKKQIQLAKLAQAGLFYTRRLKWRGLMAFALNRQASASQLLVADQRYKLKQVRYLLHTFQRWQRVVLRRKELKQMQEASVIWNAISMKRKFFATWARKTQKLQLQQTLVASALKSRTQRTIEQTFYAWYDYVRIKVQSHMAARMMVISTMRKRARNMLAQWSKYAKKAKWLQSVQAAIVDTLHQRTLKLCIQAWLLRTVQWKRQRLMISQAKLHRLRLLRKICLKKWISHTRRARIMNAAMNKLLRSTETKLLSTVMYQWLYYTRDALRRKTILLQHMKDTLVAKTFRAWIKYTITCLCARKVAKESSMKLVAKTFKEWNRAYRFKQFSRRALSMALDRKHNSILTIVFSAWRIHSVKRARESAIVHHFVSQRNRILLYGAYGKWIEKLRARQQKWDTAHAHIDSKQRILLRQILKAWAEYKDSRKDKGIKIDVAVSHNRNFLMKKILSAWHYKTWSTRLKNKTFKLWRQAVQRAKNCREAYENVVYRRNTQTRLVIFLRWKQLTQASYYHWNRALASSFLHWRLYSAYASKKRRRLEGVVGAVNKGIMRRSFLVWRMQSSHFWSSETTSSLRMNRWMAIEAQIRHQRFKLMAVTFNAWRTFARFKASIRENAEAHIEDQQRSKLLSKYWKIWKRFTYRQQERQSLDWILESYVKKKKYELLDKAFHIWSAFVFYKKQKDLASQYFSLKQRKAIFYYWKEAAMGKRSASHYARSLKRKTLRSWLSWTLNEKRLRHLESSVQKRVRRRILSETFQHMSKNAVDRSTDRSFSDTAAHYYQKRMLRNTFNAWKQTCIANKFDRERKYIVAASWRRRFLMRKILISWWRVALSNRKQQKYLSDTMKRMQSMQRKKLLQKVYRMWVQTTRQHQKATWFANVKMASKLRQILRRWRIFSKRQAVEQVRHYTALLYHQRRSKALIFFHLRYLATFARRQKRNRLEQASEYGESREFSQAKETSSRFLSLLRKQLKSKLARPRTTHQLNTSHRSIVFGSSLAMHPKISRRLSHTSLDSFGSSVIA